MNKKKNAKVNNKKIQNVKVKNTKVKNTKIKNSLKKSTSHLKCKKKVKELQNIIQETILQVQFYKKIDLIEASDLNVCLQKLENLFADINNISTLLNNKSHIDYPDIGDKIQNICTHLSDIFRIYGTKNMEDLLDIVFGKEYITNITMESNKYLYDIIKRYTHPISYKIMDWKKKNSIEKNEKVKNKQLAKNRIVEDFMLIETAATLDCFDLARTSKNFQKKVYGIKICFQNQTKRKTLIISALADDMVISCLNKPFIKTKLQSLHNNKPSDPIFLNEDFTRFCDTLTLKELMIYSNKELFQRFTGYINQIDLMKKKTISQIVKEFISNELYCQRKTLIQLLMKYNDSEFQYLAYLLYDLLNNNENNGSFDTIDQTLLFDSLPWNVKKYFRDAMKITEKYTKTLSSFDTNKIPIEQRICLMKAPDTVKEKAMLKLKEVKAKTEDSGSKARQYLDGLLKIPFSIFKKEKILLLMKEINDLFQNLIADIEDKTLNIPHKKIYSSIEIDKYTKYLTNTYSKTIYKKSIEKLIQKLCNGKRETLIANICFINSITRKYNKKKLKILHSGKKINYMKTQINLILNSIHNDNVLMKPIIEKYPDIFLIQNMNIEKSINTINTRWDKLRNTMNAISETLENSIYGHNNAKRQIERIIGQWITGKLTGYCFGFEGPPGVGKTSLARKGLANCLKDDDGTPRPFSFIALGGSSNGSTLSGHNYTYVGSTWGRIVDILMSTKCMNPIIFIDELDKVSKTENGKEIIGILTHLIDSTQNEGFQDKYFSGIDLDMSKALFIFSYNDASTIDKILLDRIHRIKFDNLTLHDKLEITNKYILPELYENIGLRDMVKIDNNVLEFVIEKYTYESGVRKLKEILFEIISEINLEMLRDTHNQEIPIVITKEDIKLKYLKERNEIRHKAIHSTGSIGIINGLWANTLGMGGIIPIECFFVPSNTFMDLKLTGLQGDVMKESMNVAKTLAWKLTPQSKQKKLITSFEKTKLQCIHIHCPEGAVPKDGPSAGTAITIAIYSLLNKLKIKNDVAITGEINLQGRVSAIGGLDLKILGGIRAGVKTFIYPDDNYKDLQKFIEKFKDKNIISDDISFIKVKNIKKVLDLVFI